jgi:hypothetical protein
MFTDRNNGQVFTAKDTGIICIRYFHCQKEISIFHLKSCKSTQLSVFSLIINLIMTSGFINPFYSRELSLNFQLFRFLAQILLIENQRKK